MDGKRRGWVLPALLWAALLMPGRALPQAHLFALGDTAFLLDGKPFQILSGELHYTRIPDAYWQDRLHKARAMGLNTVAVYCMWNVHEPQPGQWAFSGPYDVARFVRLAQAEGLWVILRPGPYVCAEWEFGGYPWWLLKQPGMKVRSRDPRFMEAARAYLLALGRQLAPLQVTRGGPILMVQVENEYGSFGRDTGYERQIARDIREAGFEVPLFTADGDWLFQHAALPGILPGANGETDPAKLKKLVNQYHGGKGPYFVPELYPGWLDHWGEKFVRVPTDRVVAETRRLLEAGVSINFYMWHGGTNFGFMSGANYNKAHPIQPDITSYDYDAPLSESGVPTEKYMALRRLLLAYHAAPGEVPAVPAAPKTITIPAIPLQAHAALLDNLPRPVHAPQPLTMEALDQGYGYVLYRCALPAGAQGLLRIPGLRDYAVVMVDGRMAGTIDRRLGQDSLSLSAPAGTRLDILVENMGRINYGTDMVDGRKGIVGQVTLNGQVLQGWNMYRLPFRDGHGLRFTKGPLPAGPVVLRGQFNLPDTGDCFVDMRGWGKGIVLVNGHPLGRYWSIGPQQTLYLPGCWLRRGRNEILVFDQLGRTRPSLAALDHPLLDAAPE